LSHLKVGEGAATAKRAKREKQFGQEFVDAAKSSTSAHHTKLSLNGIESSLVKLGPCGEYTVETHQDARSICGQVKSVGLQSSFKVQLMSHGNFNMTDSAQDWAGMRSCDKCRKQMPAKDFERHLEMCQKLVIHSSQNAQAPKIIDFTAPGSQAESSKGARKPRIASAKPPLNVFKDESSRPIKANKIPKWKL